MATTSINIRIDQNLKDEFKAFCDDMGLSMSTAFTLFAKKTVRDYCFPFVIGDPSYNSGMMEAMKEVEEIEKNPASVKSYESAGEMFGEIFADE